MTHQIDIRFVPGRFAVCRLVPDAEVPAWWTGPGFKAVVQTEDETTLVCLQDRIPEDVQCEKDWACLRSLGPFPFDAAGVVSSIISPLSDAGVGVFVLCTYDGEHVLIPSSDTSLAMKCLEEAGHDFGT